MSNPPKARGCFLRSAQLRELIPIPISALSKPLCDENVKKHVNEVQVSGS